MLCQRFRSFPDLAILLCAFATLTFLGGCGPDTGASDSSPSGQNASDEATEMPTPPGPVSDEVTEIPSDSEALEQPASGNIAEMSPVSLDPLPMAPLPTAEQPADPDLPILDSGAPVLPMPTESAKPMPSSPVTSPDLPLGQANRPLRETPPPTVEPPTVEPIPPSPFSGNPLRNGTDNLPAAPAMSDPVTEPANVNPSTEFQPKSVPEAPPKSAGKKSSKYDPVAENGPIFEGWQKPEVAILISGRQDGYLEPCGCAGLDRMKGGLTRRHSLFKQLNAEGWPLIGVDCGGLVKGFGRQAELKFHLSVDAMQKMGYHAIGLGKSDLRLPAGELLSRVASTERAPSPFLSANVAIFGFAQGLTADHRIVEAGGLRVGITSVLGTAWQKEVNNAEVEMADPQAKLRALVPKLKEQSDILVLLANATMKESEALAQAFPEFDIVVTAGGNPEAPEEMETLPGGAKLIDVGEKGMHAIVLGIYDGGKKIVYQRVPLDSRFEDSPDMKEFMRQYQQQLTADGLAGLGIRQVPHPRAKELGKFVGSKECESCHELSYETWKKTGHAKAWKTLEKLDVPRTFDPECISCHVIGWHPTEYFPYESGFLSKDETPKLIDVGCENCHGPGEKHIEAEMGADAELQLKLQKAMVVTKEQAKSDKTHWCLNCHDLDNSPDFNFEEYWPKVKHSDDVWEDEDEK